MSDITLKTGDRFKLPDGVRIHQGNDRKYVFVEVSADGITVLGWHDDDHYFRGFLNLPRVFIPEEAKPRDLMRVVAVREENGRKDFLTVIHKETL